MKRPGPIDTVSLFQDLDDELNSLLLSLTAEDWQKQTIAREWQVKDVAAHLLDGNIRAISMFRDHYFPPKPENINDYRDLVNYLNDINRNWVNAMKRVSPEMITALLKTYRKRIFVNNQNAGSFCKGGFFGGLGRRR